MSSPSSVLQSASQFNRDLSAWNVSRDADLEDMFSQAASFDQDLSVWGWKRCDTTSDESCASGRWKNCDGLQGGNEGCASGQLVKDAGSEYWRGAAKKRNSNFRLDEKPVNS